MNLFKVGFIIMLTMVSIDTCFASTFTNKDFLNKLDIEFRRITALPPSINSNDKIEKGYKEEEVKDAKSLKLQSLIKIEKDKLFNYKYILNPKLMDEFLFQNISNGILISTLPTPLKNRAPENIQHEKFEDSHKWAALFNDYGFIGGVIAFILLFAGFKITIQH